MQAGQEKDSESASGILVILEPDASVLDALQILLQGFGWRIEPVLALEALETKLEASTVTAVISEASVPGCPSSDILSACVHRHVPVIFTGHDVSTQTAVDLIRKGAIDYLEKPFSRKRLLDLLNQQTNRHND